jgi:ubiquinone/menaquinone biosynthesis C-methylase UbiE/ADP-ribose pyrophosphatase YjhB (NUDIX family)
LEDISLHDRIPSLRCNDCRTEYAIENGIPCLIDADRLIAVQDYCKKYDKLRLREGWASETPEFYQRLPFCDLSGRHSQEWALRARSFQFLQSWLENIFGAQSIRILDIGAGSGWMSRRLAERGEVLAIDVNAGPYGLSALPAEQRNFMAVQAELEHLPFASNSFDAAIANASLHYAKNLNQFFAKISRVLRPGGKLIVMDSPTYPTLTAASTAHERTQAYYAQMGIPELAEKYAGLIEKIFSEQQSFRFARWRRDFATASLLKKWLREKMGKPVAARFPIWIGERQPLPEEKWKPGRCRAGAVIIHNQQLLTYHFKNEKKECWRIPGGGIEINETPEQAAQRELREELNLPIAIRRQFGPYFRANKSEWYFLSEADPEKLPAHHSEAPEDFGKIMWLPLEKLANCDVRPPSLKWELVEFFNNA